MSPNPASPGGPAFAATSCILVVEDELLIRLMLSDELRDAGFQVIEAANAAEALTILKTVGPDLIVSDVRMPGYPDGMGLLALVRETHPTLPVIITSGHLQSNQAFAEGATRFVRKPYTMESVVEVVRKLLEESS
jgi:DNA-binding NtrC family response regulator